MALTVSHAIGPSEPPVRDVTLGQPVAEVARRHPDRPAIIGLASRRRTPS